METKEKINSIRQQCILANPEIVELKFGCSIQQNKGNGPEMILRVRENHPFTFSAWLWRESFGAYSTFDILKKDIEILGRPIRLADVLLAIGVEATTLGDLLWPEESKTTWNLLRDSLEDQEEPTINFIHELIQK